MSFKNLRNPTTNADPPTPEKLRQFPRTDDMSVNGERNDGSPNGEPEKTFGPPQTLPEARPPMKLKE